MLITIINTPRGKRFMWSEKIEGEGRIQEYTVSILLAPSIASGEGIEIRRSGTIVAKGTISWIGTHASRPAFCIESGGEGCRRGIYADDFKMDDVIKITPARPPEEVSLYFERFYWSSMLLLDYGEESKLYNKRKKKPAQT